MDPPFAKGSDKLEYIIFYGNSFGKTVDTHFMIKNDIQTKRYKIEVCS